MSLREDPSSIAPHRAIVFEIAGSIANFYKAARRIPGLEFIAEDDYEFEPDDDFSMLDDEQLPDQDQQVSGRLYLAMPTEGALEDILRLYRNWRRGRSPARGFTPWRDLFLHLKDMRAWGPQDRISKDAIALWREEIHDADITEVRVEAELFYHSTERQRNQALHGIGEAVAALNGGVITSAVIPEIGYHAALLRVPVAGIQHLINRDEVDLVLADQIMFLRPQASIRGPNLDVKAPSGRTIQRLVASSPPAKPIVALLDGMPLQNHDALANRLVIDDPDGIERLALVGQRHHGTAMASLILHGDLNVEGASLSRPLFVHPVLYATALGANEETNRDRLLLDTIYRAIVRMKDPTANGGPTAPDVIIVNLSLGDRRRAFSGPMSPFGRLVDYLASRYNLLFMISGGNITSDVTLPDYNSLADLEAADPESIARAFLAHLRDNQANRCLLSPAEALNSLTIAAAHDDSVAAGFPHTNSVAPYPDVGFPNVSSALGLGHRRVIKPDLMLPGGKERLRMKSTRPLVLRHPDIAQGCGLLAAAPDSTGRAQLNRRSLLCGTSAATALASRAAHQIFDSMMDVDGGSNLAEIDPTFWPVVVKTLLVHSARWSSAADLIADVFGPAERRRHADRADNVSRLIGYGSPEISRVMECSPSQATLVGYGEIDVSVAHEYRVPLPSCLEAVTEPRTVIVTLAWLSPVSTVHLDYRRAQLLIDVPGHLHRIGVRRLVDQQPSDFASKRGSVIHEIYGGENAIVFIDDGHLVLRVICRERPSTLRLSESIRYGVAVTVEAGQALPVYQEVAQRVAPLISPRP